MIDNCEIMAIQVANVLGYIAPRYGGPPQFAIELSKQLEAVGVRSAFWATATPSEIATTSPEVVNQAYLFSPQSPLAWFYSSELEHQFRSHALQYDLIHIHEIWTFPLWAASVIAKQNNIPYIVTPHGIFNAPWRYCSPKKRLYLRLVALQMMNGARAIHVTTELEKRELLQLGVVAPIWTIPNAVNCVGTPQWIQDEDTNRLDRILNNKRVVLFLSRISPEKGLMNLVQAWKLTDRENSTLVIAGPDSRGYRAAIEHEIAECQLDSSILFTGEVAGNLKNYLIDRSNVYVLPSLSEGFSLSLLENLSAGTPSICTRNCNFDELLEAEAGLVVDSDIRQLADALNLLLTKSDVDLARMGMNAMHLIEKKYTWNVTRPQFFKMYSSSI